MLFYYLIQQHGTILDCYDSIFAEVSEDATKFTDNGDDVASFILLDDSNALV